MAIAAAGLVVTGIVYLLIDRAEERRIHDALELRVEWRAKDLERKIDAAREALVATSVFLSSQDDINLEEFQRFTIRARRDNRPIAAVDWVPHVPRALRATFEADATRATGKPYEILEHGPGGQFVRAGDRDDYLPILAQTRFEDFPSVAGFDMASDAARAAVMGIARDTGRPKATLPVQPLATEQPTFIAFWPVYESSLVPASIEKRREILRGFAVGVFRVGAVVAAGLADTPDLIETLNFYLSDDGSELANDGVNGLPVARSSPGTKEIQLSPITASPSAAYRFTRSFEIMGQRWGLEFLFSNSAVSATRSNGPIAALIAGLLLTGILMAYVSRERSRTYSIQRKVDERTAELTASEDRTRQQAALLRDAVNAMADGFVLYDAEDRLTLSNERYREIRGHDPILNKPGVRFEEIARAALARGQMPHVKDPDTWIRDRLVRHRSPTGPLLSQVGGKWYRVSEHRTSDGGTVAIHADITELKRAETEIAAGAQALQNSNASFEAANTKLQTLIDASPMPIVSLDAKQRVTIWSAAAERSFGYTAEETLGRPYPLVPAAGREEFNRLFQAVMGGESVRDIFVQRQHKDGRTMDIVFSGAPLYDSAQRVAGAVYILEDVTDKRRVERQLAQAQKMEAVGQLSGGIAHDFNNILGVVVGNLDELIDVLRKRSETATSDVDADIQLLGSEALNAALRGSELVRRLLAFSRNQPLQPKTIDVGKLIADMDPMLRRTLGEQITITTAVPQDLWPVTADQAQFENVVLNLAINARDAMPEGGALTLMCRNIQFDEAAAGTTDLRPGNYVMLSVADTGTGIPADVLPRVFEPFFTTKEIGKGSGLGLSMVYGYARQSGGTAKIYSEMGRGTEVRIYLPRSDDAAMRSPTPGTEGAAAPVGKERILVVEDKKEVRDMACKLLESLGYRILQAENGAEAIEALDNSIPDLLFTDIVMPGKMSGIDVAREARRRFPNLPIVFTSGFSNPETVRLEAVALGASLISKPYRKADLAKQIRTALDGAKK